MHFLPQSGIPPEMELIWGFVRRDELIWGFVRRDISEDLGKTKTQTKREVDGKKGANLEDPTIHTMLVASVRWKKGSQLEKNFLP